TLDILQHLKEKALAAANSTANDRDRAAIQQELNQFIDQINDNSLVTFNGQYLVDGSKEGPTELTTQAFTNQLLSTDTTGSTKLTDLNTRYGDNLGIQSSDTVTVSYVKDGHTFTKSYGVADTTLEDIFKQANLAGGGDVFDTTLGDTEVIGTGTDGKEKKTASEENAITVKAAESGKAGALAGFTISVSAADGTVKKSVNASLDAFSESIAAANKKGDNSLVLQTGTKPNQNIKASLGGIDARSLGLQGSDGSYLNVGTQANANAAINVIDNAINKVLEQSTNVGALSSRLEYTHSNLTTQSENLTAAMTTLISADIAKEITNMATDSMLAQASQAMLAQSYQNSSWFLNLLG
ncbi:MAG: flagellin, partial [Anaerovibrio sp.]|nr:flagellin [Anaerovibrio sp.]